MKNNVVIYRLIKGQEEIAQIEAMNLEEAIEFFEEHHLGKYKIQWGKKELVVVLN